MRKAGQARQMRLHSVTKQTMAEFGFDLYFRVAFLSLLLSLASGDCVDLDLGMENGTILDEKITASSEKNMAKNGRLNSSLSWCAGTSDSNPYLQIDLQTLHIICAVSTQGNSQANEWVTNYTLQSSIDGSSWTNYEEDGVVKTFVGNIDRNSEVKHVLYGVLTRYLRFLPKTHQTRVCMRTEVFGVKTKPVNLAFGRTTDQSSTNNYNSSVSGVSGNAVDGNPDTDFGSGHCSRTNPTNPSWWRVYLGPKLVPVSEVFIVNSNEQQGNKDYKITLGSSSDVTKNDACEGLYSFVDFQASAVCFTNPLTTGRYVGIMTTKSQVLQLCEVEVYSRENLAFDKPTFQHSGTYKDGISSKAVDGNSNTHFQYGKPEGSCTMTDRTNKPWWGVDLQQVEHVSEVYIVNRGSECSCPDRFKNFEIRVGTDSSGTSLANPTCGGTYTYSLPVGKGTSFFCHPSLKGRYVIIRILKPKTPLTLCEVEVYSERRACQMQAIGVTSKDAFPDNRFSASSGGNIASKGRLNGAGAWSPSNKNDANDYLQIDLLYEFVICAVATQGSPTADHWTTKYKLQLALIHIDKNWFTYQEDNIDKVFNGNSGRNDIVKHSLKEYATARFIRVLPTNFSTHKALRVEVYGILISAVPSQAPSGFTVVASTSTSITASWQLPPKYARHGNITGFKLFYAKKGSEGSPTVFNVTSLTQVVSGLLIYTEYEFQVLAFSSKGDGPKSSVVFERTKEDAPSSPAPLTTNVLHPDMSHGPRVKLNWTIPAEPNGVIRSYTVFYSHNGNTQKETFGKDTLSYSVDVLGGLTYEFHVRAVTIKPGENASLTVDVPEYRPSIGPYNVSYVRINTTTFNISWALLTREKSNGKAILYEVKQELLSQGKRRTKSPSNRRTLNTTATFVVLYDLPLCSQYHVSVRAYTKIGPGPYTQPTLLDASKTEAPTDLRETNSGSTEVTLEWTKPKVASQECVNYTVKYSGTKLYDKTFTDTFDKNVGKLTKYTVTGLVPGSTYQFQVYATSVCGKSSPIQLKVDTKIAGPPRIAKEVSPSSVTCEMQTLCTLSCHATSDSPFNYSWTKSGQVPVSDDIKIMNNIIVLTPRDTEDYGVYVCHATNSIGSTAYKITVSEGHKSSALADVKRTYNAAVTTLSCIVFVLLVIIGVFIWRLRRASPINKATATDKVITDTDGKPDSPLDQPVSEPGLYMDLHPRSLDGQSGAPAECKSLQGKGKNTEYYNVKFSKQGSGRKLVSPHDQRVTEPAAYMELQPRPSKGPSHPLPEYTSLQGRTKSTEYYNV